MDGPAALICTTSHPFSLCNLVSVISLISGESILIPFKWHQLCPLDLVFWTWHIYLCLSEALGLDSVLGHAVGGV